MGGLISTILRLFCSSDNLILTVANVLDLLREIVLKWYSPNWGSVVLSKTLLGANGGVAYPQMFQESATPQAYVTYDNKFESHLRFGERRRSGRSLRLLIASNRLRTFAKSHSGIFADWLPDSDSRTA